MKYYSLFIISIVFSFSVNSQNEQKIKNLKAFAKAYGYVKYFHPSDEAADINWNNFAIYGAEQMEKCSSKEDVVESLNKLFTPIASSVHFTTSQNKTDYNLATITPKKLTTYELTYWQHQGVGVGMKPQKRIYESVRVNRNVKTESAFSFGNIITSISAEKFQGKEIKYTGWVQVEKGTKGTGHLWFRVDNNDKSMGFFDNMRNRPIKSNDWQQYEIIGTVDKNADKLVFGCFLKGKGKLFMDNIQLFYKEGNEWVEIPIPNNNFETEPLGLKKGEAQWMAKGSGYEIVTTTKNKYGGEKSAMINYSPTIEIKKGKKLFAHEPKFGAIIEKEIGKNIYCQIPLVLYCNKENTYPKGNDKDINRLKETINKMEDNPKNLAVRLGNVINVYNVFQHFYPYFDVTDVNWETEFEKALERCFIDQTEKDHLITLQKFTASLKDGHIWVSESLVENATPPIRWEWVENKLVITQILDSTLTIKVGDVVTKIDGELAKDYFREVNSKISAATKGWLNYRAQKQSLLGIDSSKMTITINNKDIELTRKVKYLKGNSDKVAHKKIDDDIYYLNLDHIEMEEIDQLLPKLKKSKAIICDLRGYPNGNHNFISYLLNENDTSRAWMQIPQITFPDHENQITYDKKDWGLKAKAPYLGDKKIIFITNGRAISYAESYMGFIEGYKLATIIGQPTAGTNGNVNRFSLPGGYKISWTGMKVLKHDGTQHHGIGILPTIYVNKTIKGISDGKDEFLEKAIEFAKQP